MYYDLLNPNLHEETCAEKPIFLHAQTTRRQTPVPEFGNLSGSRAVFGMLKELLQLQQHAPHCHRQSIESHMPPAGLCSSGTNG